MIRTLAVIAIVAASSSACACSGVVRQDVEGTIDFEAVHKGDVLEGLDHAVRDAASGSMMVCGEKCYPAIGRDNANDQLAEIVELRGCTVGEMVSDEDGIETYDLDDENGSDKRRK